MEYLER